MSRIWQSNLDLDTRCRVSTAQISLGMQHRSVLACSTDQFLGMECT
ncbi:hypothetical protein OAO87_03855 [bacterium]|nr:hypothetical protein [bacterium]